MSSEVPSPKKATASQQRAKANRECRLWMESSGTDAGSGTGADAMIRAMQYTTAARSTLFVGFLLTVACGASAPNYNLPCSVYTVPSVDLKYKTQEARVEVEWHEEWTSRFGETLPEPSDRRSGALATSRF